MTDADRVARPTTVTPAQFDARWCRLAGVMGALLVTGLSAVVLTFFLVSLQPEGKVMSTSGAVSDQNPPFGPRFAKWGLTVISSGFTDWGGSTTAPDVSGLLRDRLPVSARIGLKSWLIAWGGGLALAIALSTSRRWAEAHLRVAYPIVQAVPPLTVVFLGYAFMVWIAPKSVETLGMMAGIAALSGLLLPAAGALWLNALRRVLGQEFVRVARASGMSPFRLWARHVLPNAIVSSGVLTQAAFSLAGLMVGSIFVEKVFSLGGIAGPFLEAVRSGQAELAATAVVVYFTPLALGVCLAEGIVLWLQPEQDGETS